MSWGQIGAVLAVLVIVFVAGNLWFHFVEAIFCQLKKWCFKNKKPTAWHTLPPEQELEGNEDG
ncbi:hypothetical protein [Cuneatibacter caecimuris]|uniref:Uncharacterized protein n=1 Tax=Cuneatibacter caecimuris TaxID=1796618 RepID=A0A4Q7P3X3_9FIRM|nr:hypothetical protein [Cuneatibacter caecimuris]RZS94120.1 hypothetical protein EV209_2488 [Cuneatibacter caecimuris]